VSCENELLLSSVVPRVKNLIEQVKKNMFDYFGHVYGE
jgi:hypothetical protein